MLALPHLIFVSLFGRLGTGTVTYLKVYIKSKRTSIPRYLWVLVVPTNRNGLKGQGHDI